MNTLCIIDVSAVVYTGLYSQRYQDRSAFGYPTGGIHFFMEQLLVPLYEYNDIVLCFDSPNFRKKLESSYKSGRSHNAVAISQIEALYEYLSYCGFSCYKCDGYEADDIIDWVIDTFKEKYSPIIIVGNDMDLAHSIRPNVIFRSCRSDMNIIKRSSFPNAIKKDVYIPYNMVSIWKCLCGCQSDGVPQFRTEGGLHGSELYDTCVQTYVNSNLVDDYDKTTSIHLFKFWAEKSGLFSDQDLKKLDTRIKVIFPAECPEDLDFKPVNKSHIDYDKMSKVLTMFNVADALFGTKNCNGVPMKNEFWRVQLTDSDKQLVYDLAHRLNSGEYNADKSIPMNTERVTSSPLKISAFEKEF